MLIRGVQVAGAICAYASFHYKTNNFRQGKSFPAFTMPKISIIPTATDLSNYKEFIDILKTLSPIQPKIQDFLSINKLTYVQDTLDYTNDFIKTMLGSGLDIEVIESFDFAAQQVYDRALNIGATGSLIEKTMKLDPGLQKALQSILKNQLNPTIIHQQLYYAKEHLGEYLKHAEDYGSQDVPFATIIKIGTSECLKFLSGFYISEKAQQFVESYFYSDNANEGEESSAILGHISQGTSDHPEL